jgi:hypothetical protein
MVVIKARIMVEFPGKYVEYNILPPLIRPAAENIEFSLFTQQDISNT